MVATNEIVIDTYPKKKAEREKRTYASYHSINCYGKLAEVMGMLLQKGTLVAVDGKLRYYKRRIGNQMAYVATVYAEDVAVLADFKEWKPEGEKEEATEEAESEPETKDEDHGGE